MAGLGVSPFRPSSTTNRASSPDAMIPRRRLSYQMLCPYRSSSRSRFATVAPLEARLERADLRDAPRVPLLAVEAGGQERLRELERERLADDARAEREDVHRVVLDALVRGVVVVADAGEDARDLVRRGRHADAAAADEDRPLGPPVEDRPRGRLGVIRVVARRGVVRAEVDRLVPERREVSAEPLLEREPRVVPGERDPHAIRRNGAAGARPRSRGVKARGGGGLDERLERSLGPARGPAEGRQHPRDDRGGIGPPDL